MTFKSNSLVYRRHFGFYGDDLTCKKQKKQADCDGKSDQPCEIAGRPGGFELIDVPLCCLSSPAITHHR